MNKFTDGPEIVEESVIIHTKKGESEELVCIVHSHPASKVSWQRKGHIITSKTPNILLNNVHNRHSLTLLSISKDMLGDYECNAENKLGRVSRSLKVKGIQSLPFIPPDI